MKKLFIIFLILAFAAPAFPLDFVAFVSDNVPGWTAAEKLALLNDFCASHSYETNKKVGEAKNTFMNRMITEFIRGSVDTKRKRRAEIAAVWVPLGEIP